MTDAIELARRHRLHTIAPWKQPALRSRRLPPGTQQFEEMRIQHHVAVFAAFALLDANDHAFAIDVADLERDHLSGALYLSPRAAASSRATSSGLRTTGSLRGSWRNVVCSMMSERLSVILKK